MLIEMSKIGIYPGSFNPPTFAHAAIAEAALDSHGLSRLDIVVSESALGKDDVSHPRLSDRIRVLRSSFERFDNIEVKVTEKQLLSDMSQGYDLLVLGGDKWAQIQELRWYADGQDRERALSMLPAITIAARSNINIPEELRLEVAQEHVQNISSTAARAGRHHMMTEAALAFAKETGAWVDTSRYEQWSRQDRGD